MYQFMPASFTRPRAERRNPTHGGQSGHILVPPGESSLHPVGRVAAAACSLPSPRPNSPEKAPPKKELELTARAHYCVASRVCVALVPSVFFDHFLIRELESMHLSERAMDLQRTTSPGRLDRPETAPASRPTVDDGSEQEEAGAGREETSVSATPTSMSAADDTPTDQEAQGTGEDVSMLLDDWLRGFHRTLQQGADRRREPRPDGETDQGLAFQLRLLEARVRDVWRPDMT